MVARLFTCFAFSAGLVAGGAVIASSPLAAQSAQEAVSASAEAALDAAKEAAADAIEEVADAPPTPVLKPSAGEVDDAPRVTSAYPKKPRPITGLWQLIRQADYPVSAWRNDEEGSVEYDLTIDAEGKAKKCMISVSSGSAALDAATCAIATERMRFKPALADADTPIEGVYFGNYRWRKREPDAPPITLTMQYLHSEKGVTSNCEILSLEGEIPTRMQQDIDEAREKGELCPRINARGGVPYRDENGVPVARRVTISVDIVVEEIE